MLIVVFFLAVAVTCATLSSYAFARESTINQPINGVVMKGVFVGMKQNNDALPLAPDNYIEDSLKMISNAGLNHVRFVFYWEAYERDPDAFMNEIKSVANAADKYGLNIIYDNHQWHTSSWFDEKATGFPWSLIENNSRYSKNDGGNTQDKGAQKFWADWWDRSVKGNDGKDGWTLMAEFLKKIVLTVDNHSSTLGYEILSEPHVDKIDQWSKIGKFNSFMTSELRMMTDKTIAYSMNVPVDLNGPIKVSPENLAKMAPSEKQNVVFKISVYGVPDRDDYQRDRFDMFLKTRDLTGVPLYIGEWNNVVRTRDGGVFRINPGQSELTKNNAGEILGAFKEAGIWGTAFWKWDYRDADTKSFNLVSDSNGGLNPTKYFDILKDTVETVYGSINFDHSNVPIDTEQAATVDTESGIGDVKQNNLINELVKTGKFTEIEAREFVTKSIQTRTDTKIVTDNTTLSASPAPITTSTANMDDNIDIVTSSSKENTSTSNISLDTNANPEDYHDLAKLIDDIKNKRVDFEIPLNAFKNSGAYQGTDEEMQSCIDLAGKIGHNLIDYEIVHCSEDTDFFKNQLTNTEDSSSNN